MNNVNFLIIGLVVGLVIGAGITYVIVGSQISSLQQNYNNLNTQYQSAVSVSNSYQSQIEQCDLQLAQLIAIQPNYDLLINAKPDWGSNGLLINPISTDASTHSVTDVVIKNTGNTAVTIESICLMLQNNVVSWTPSSQVPIVASYFIGGITIAPSATVNIPVSLSCGQNPPSSSYAIKVITSDGKASFFPFVQLTMTGTNYIG